jgi:hypothetical protein
MPPPDDASGLDRLQQKLYAPQTEVADPHTELKARPQAFTHAWKQAVPPVLLEPKHHMRLAKKFFLFSLLFFVFAMGVAAYLFLSNSRTVSTDNIGVAIQGPTTVAGGDTVPLSITITNRNPVAITNASITIDFPAGTRSADNVLTPYPRYTENLGTLAPGQSVQRSVKAVVFGSGGQAVTLPVTLSYGTSGSNATFIKQSSYGLTISTAPLSVSVDTLAETVSGKPLTLEVTVRSNATAAVSGVVLQAQFPFGFTVSSTNLTPVGSTFPLGTLQPGDTKKIKITGILAGSQGDSRVFHFTVGTADADNPQILGVSYMTQDATVNVTAPFLATTLTLNGSSADQVSITSGSRVSAQLSWTNTLPTDINNADVEVKLSGTAFDPSSVQVDRGFYRSADNTIVFNSQTDPSLGNLAPNASGVGSFSFSTVSGAAAQGLRNPTLTLSISVSGTRTGQSSVPESISSTLTKTISLATAVTLDSYGLHSSGPFSNGGPLPPVANTQTAYAIIWKVQNSANAIAGTQVTATLPAYVAFAGATSPNDGSITYNAASRTVTWSVGDLAAGASKQGAFQVSFTPSSSQHGQSPTLVNTPTLTAIDRFAQVNVTTTGNAVSTEITRDPSYVSGQDEVQ